MERLPSESLKEVSEPYGRGPALLALRASDLLYDLCDVPEWSEAQRWRWVTSDKLAFHGWYSLEVDLLDALAEPGLDRTQVYDILNQVTDFRQTLPFDNGEASWLFNAYAPIFFRGDAISVIRQRKPEEIVSCGLRRVVDGRELLRRWWAWRRETDEYRGQGTIDLARAALRALAAKLSPDLDVSTPFERPTAAP
jgi:hypothetical protein